MTALGSVHVQSDNVRYGRGHLTPHRGNQARPPTGSCPIYYSCPIDHTMTIPLVILSRDDVQVIRVRMQWLNCRKKSSGERSIHSPFPSCLPLLRNSPWKPVQTLQTIQTLQQFKHLQDDKMFDKSYNRFDILLILAFYGRTQTEGPKCLIKRVLYSGWCTSLST